MRLRPLRSAFLSLIATAAAAAPPPPPRQAIPADRFLASLGINTHIDQGYDETAYVDPVRYLGVTQIRDGARHADRDIDLHQKTGVRFTVSGGGDLDGLLATARTLARAHALLALEGPNEPNNFPIRYGGRQGGGPGHSWIPIALFQRDLARRAKADRLLAPFPIFGPSEVGAETDDVGLQFLTIPKDVATTTALPPGTRFADFANVHNYVSGNVHGWIDNQAFDAADPVVDGRWDGLHGNYGLTWHAHYRGYADQDLPDLPRVTTETGWDSVSDPGGEHAQAAVLTDVYLSQFKRGWAHTFIYELRDGEGGAGHQGLYDGARPKLAATWLHNLTAILASHGGHARPARLAYGIDGQPSTVHDLLLAKRDGRLDLVVWDERVHGTDRVTVRLAHPASQIALYDIGRGAAPISRARAVATIPLTLSDHAVILEIAP